MVESTPKRKIKDSVFTNLFQDKKYLLQLYKALHPEDCNVTEDDIADVTIKHVLVDTDYNDLYVIFTGERKNTPSTISLSKEFFKGARIAVDVEVKVLYQESEKDIIGQYIIFSKVYNKQRKLHGNTKRAVIETIRICKDRNVSKEYLESKEQEVVDMMMTLFDDEQILKAYTKDIKDDATKETERETAKKMIKKGKMTLEEIADCVSALSLDELKKLEAEIA